MFRALLDTCVLFKPLLCDSLLSLAEEGLYQPLWSADILIDLRRNLARHGVIEIGIEHRITQMTTHFPDSMVTDYRRLIPAMSNHPRDRHVLAAAVRGGAEMLVTENLRDFPSTTTKPFDVEVQNQDTFLLDLLDLAPHQVFRALNLQASRYLRAPRTVNDLLIALGRRGNGCAGFATECLDLLSS